MKILKIILSLLSTFIIFYYTNLHLHQIVKLMMVHILIVILF